jgi:hypothetical protein
VSCRVAATNSRTVVELPGTRNRFKRYGQKWPQVVDWWFERGLSNVEVLLAEDLLVSTGHWVLNMALCHFAFVYSESVHNLIAVVVRD